MGNSEFEKFDATVRKVFSVSRDEMQKREKEYQRQRKAQKQKLAQTSDERKAK